MLFKTTMLILLLPLYSSVALAQTDKKDQSFKSTTLAVPIEKAFDKIVDYLQVNEMFISTMDKQAGFIQAKAFVKDRKVLSAKMGDRYTFNFILRPEEAETSLSLNIYVEEYNFGGDVKSRSYYYEDKGILKDKNTYQDILVALQDAVKE
jgi:hypothetical protein